MYQLKKIITLELKCFPKTQKAKFNTKVRQISMEGA
jgi:hypothetical protein